MTTDDETYSLLMGNDDGTIDLDRKEREYADLQRTINPYAYAQHMNSFLEGNVDDIENGVFQVQLENLDDEAAIEKYQKTVDRYLRYHKILKTRERKNEIVKKLNTEKDEDGQPLIDWKRYSYMTYATDPEYLCNALMMFDQLKNVHGSQAKMTLLYPTEWGTPSGDVGRLAQEEENKKKKGSKKDPTMPLLRVAQDKYGINLVPIRPLSFGVKKSEELQNEYFRNQDTWKHSFTKILAFNHTEFDRVIMLDADAFVMHPLDYLFFEDDEAVFGKDQVANTLASEKYWDKPQSEKYPAIQAPPAYWLVPDSPEEEAWIIKNRNKGGFGTPAFTTMMEVITPSKSNFKRIKDRFKVLEHFHINEKLKAISKQMERAAEDKKTKNKKNKNKDAHVQQITRPKFYDMELLNDAFANVTIIGDDEIFQDESARDEVEAELWGLTSGAIEKYTRANNSYGVLDHRGLIILTGELAQEDHSKYLKNYVSLQREGAEDNGQGSVEQSKHRESTDLWDPIYAISTTAFIHFSDWPFPKPWKQANAEEVLKSQPACEVVGYRTKRHFFKLLKKKVPIESCDARDLWHMFYLDFEKRRKDVCEMHLSHM